MTSQRGYSCGTWHMGTVLLCRHLEVVIGDVLKRLLACEEPDQDDHEDYGDDADDGAGEFDA